MHEQHQPVLLEEVIEGLNIKKSGIYIDGTFGRGGHAKEILKRLGPKGRLLVADKDNDAISVAKKIDDKRLKVCHTPIVELYEVVKGLDWLGKVDGIILDLGVSSPQLDNPNRGFSFLKDGPLDMRMNQRQHMSASKWLNMADESEIKHVLKIYGQETSAKYIAREIVKQRKKEPITTTGQLSALVKKVIPSYKRKHHVATRTFQAIRIFINRELEELEIFLAHTLDILAIGGRLCIITFHSLENKIAKRFIKNLSTIDLPTEIPLTAAQTPKPRLKIISTKTPTEAEINSNIRSRSARLSIVEKQS